MWRSGSRRCCGEWLLRRCGGKLGSGHYQLSRVLNGSACNLWQPGLRQTIGNTPEISGILVGQDVLTLDQRESRIHLENLGPCHARILPPAEMAVACCQHHAT